MKTLSRSLVILLLFFFPAAGRAEEGDGATLHVRVEGIQARKGELGIALFDKKKGYPIHIEHAYDPVWFPLEKGEKAIEHEFEGLPAGDYAVSVLHDEDGDRKMDRSTLGFPEEGVGFSNNQKVKLSAPDYDDCSFMLTEDERKEIVIKMDYRD